MDITPRLPPATDDIDWMLVVRYLAGECSSIEVSEVEAWLAGAPHRAERLQWLREASVGVATRAYHFDIDSAWGRLSIVPRVQQTKSAGSTSLAARQQRWPRVGAGMAGRILPTRRGRLLAVRVAITTMVVVVLGAAIAIGSSRHHGAIGSPGRAYATGAGQRLSVTLVDGTRLTLAPASRVRVGADYGEQGETGGSKTRPYGARDVELEGEAFFAVVHDAAHPFAVRTRGAVVRDVGTAFDVRAYSADGAGARVAVVAGEVEVAVATSVAGAVRQELLHAGGIATVTHGEIAVEQRTMAAVARLTAWMQGRLVFEDTPLRDVARELGRAFGLDVTVGDSVLASRRVTATFGDEPEDEVLDAVAQIVGGRYERTGRRVVIRPYHGAADWQQPIRPMPVATAQARPTA